MKKIYGVGVNDYEGKVTFVVDAKKKLVKSYSAWVNMLQRCYSNKCHEKYQTYIGCKVSQEWLSYSNFKEWFDKNYPAEMEEEVKFELDKDLKVEENKIYSKDTCLFIPNKINSFMTNKQSNNKSGYIGVSFKTKEEKYVAQIRDFETGKLKYLGCFKSAVDASKAYVLAREYMTVLAKAYMEGFGIYSEEVINRLK